MTVWTRTFDRCGIGIDDCADIFWISDEPVANSITAVEGWLVIFLYLAEYSQRPKSELVWISDDWRWFRLK